jgi:hypothetical protein
MDAQQELVFRYDNAPHHKHLRQGEQESEEPTLEDVLLEIAQREREDMKKLADV